MSGLRNFSVAGIVLVVLCFCICLAGAFLLPAVQCPDEFGRQLLSDWMVETGTLPTGDETETMILGWGFSYALRPYLSAVVGAVFQRAAMFFTASPRVLLAASRMCSVLSVTACCYFCLRLGGRLFDCRVSAVLFAALVCFLPQVLFLGMYQNNDALSLCAVSMMLYYVVEGYDLKWPVRSCVGLVAGFSLGLLSYYSVFGWIVICALFCILAILADPEIEGKGKLILRRAALVAGLCLVLAGWFYIRNGLLHDGDVFGLTAEAVSRARMREQGYELFSYQSSRSNGVSILEFLQDSAWWRLTAWSFIGMFGYMDLCMPQVRYGIYYAVFLLGLLLFAAVLLRRGLSRRGWWLMILILVSSGITLLLHFWNSYARDWQPQGRYVITLALPLGLAIAHGLDKTGLCIRSPDGKMQTELLPAAALTVIWLLLFAVTAVDTMSQML